MTFYNIARKATEIILPRLRFSTPWQEALGHKLLWWLNAYGAKLRYEGKW